MLSLPGFLAVAFFAVLHLSSASHTFSMPAKFQSKKLESPSNPSVSPVPSSRCNPKCGSVFTNEQSVAIFTSTFLQAVNRSSILKRVFDLSQTTARQYRDFCAKYTITALTALGIKNAKALTEFAFRGIVPNFEVLTFSVITKVFANSVANFLLTDGDLTVGNANALGLKFAKVIAIFAKLHMNSHPASKFKALSNGYVKFLLSVVKYEERKVPLVAYYLGNEWYVAAVNYKWC